MPDFPVIDVHVHTHRDARTGLQSQGGRALTSHGWAGTIDELLPAMAAMGVEKAVQVNFTPVWDMLRAGLRRLPSDLTGEARAQAEAALRDEMAGRVQRRNQWTCDMAQTHPDRLVAYVGIDPVQGPEAMAAGLEACAGSGARGVKLHTVLQHVSPSDRRLYPGYEVMQRRGMALLAHAGPLEIAADDPDQDIGRPSAFDALAHDFPRLTIVLAHCGGKPFYQEAAALAAEHANVYFDCTGQVFGFDRGARSDQDIVAMFRAVGVDRVMFGSDWAFLDPLPDIRRIEGLPLSAGEKRMILAGNARRILGL